MFNGRMERLALTDLYLPDDARVHAELRGSDREIVALAQSIQTENLINPITVHIPADASPPYRIIAGGRRYTACKRLGWRDIPCRIFADELTEHQLRSIELVENVRRRNLSPQEEGALLAELERLMLAQEGPKIARRADAPGYTRAKLAEVTGLSEASVSNKMRLHTAHEQNPHLHLYDMKPTRALKHLERAAQSFENYFRAQVVEQVVVQSTPDVAERDAQTTNMRKLLAAYRVGDFFANDLPDATFAFIECDPPYGFELAANREALVFPEDYHEEPSDTYYEYLQRLCAELYRLAAPHSWVMLWHKAESYRDVFVALQDAGFAPRYQCGIWKKGINPGQTQNTSGVFGNAYEQFVYAAKGRAMLYREGHSAIFDYDRVQTAHPTGKPLALYNDLIACFAASGAAMLVPFAGSGSALIAGILNGLHVVGYDLSEQFRTDCIARASSMPAFMPIVR